MRWSYFKVYCIVRPQSLFTFASSLKAKCVSTNSVCTPSVQKIKSVNEIFIITNVLSHTYWANGYTVVLTDRQIEYWARRMQKLNVFIFFFFCLFFSLLLRNGYCEFVIIFTKSEKFTRPSPVGSASSIMSRISSSVKSRPRSCTICRKPCNVI